MPMLFVIFVGSAVLALLLTPLRGALAFRCGLVDRPDGKRKIHSRPIPRAGALPYF